MTMNISHEAPGIEASFGSEEDPHADETSFAGDHQVLIAPVEQREEIASKENKAVFWLRVLVLAVLLVSAVTVGVSVYTYMSGEEQDEYEQQFHSDAAKVKESMGKTLDNTLGATDAFIVNFVAYARYSNSSWPFVTMPDFEIHGNKVLRLSKAIELAWVPIVEANQKEQWEKYASEKKGWIEDTLDVMEKNKDWNKPIVREYATADKIVGYYGQPVDSPTPYMDNYLPNWQTTPSLPHSFFPYNVDYWRFDPAYSDAYSHSIQSRKVSITTYTILSDPDPNDPEQVAIYDSMIEWAKTYIEPDEDPTEPGAGIAYPVVDSLDSIQVDITKKDKPVVGIIVFALFWRRFIKDILPANSNGIVVVFEQECGPSFTYRLDGPTPVYLGAGDLHDPKYDDIGYTSTFVDLMKTTKAEGDNTYTGLPLTEEYCPKSISLYPSAHMEDEFKTSDPLIFTLAAIFIFLFTSIVFVSYDLWVARRQRIVLNRAIASGTIVSSLFPEKVRKQLYQENLQKESSATGNNLKTFMVSNEQETVKASKPMADLFEETTILFADLAGFTAWSSKRTPTQVFELLEAIYGAFDEIAIRYNVFKIETIGDCYVAATGIPEPQKDHAVIMARFARKCMLKMNQVVNELVDSLGDDTASLEMRVGLHSGSTTAGVLRGQKSRFQLFGDTVNTAARMESNGMRGRIHVSQATADALINSGKGQWLTPREEKITAKGKGEMQTYWVNTDNGAGSRASLRSGTLDASTESSAMKNPAANTASTERASDELDSDRLMAYLGRGSSVEVDA